MGKLKKARDRIEWMRRNKGSVKWRHVTELLGWLGFGDPLYVKSSHYFWVHPVLGNEENPLELVRPHHKGTEKSMSRSDVAACADAAQDVLDVLEREVLEREGEGCCIDETSSGACKA